MAEINGTKVTAALYPLTAAQKSLAMLEEQLALLPAWEQQTIEIIRNMLREMNQTYPAHAALAMMATSFEISIEKGE